LRTANVNGRLAVVVDDAYSDVYEASKGRFGPDPQAIFDDWDAFKQWASTFEFQSGVPAASSVLGPPVPAPRQIFAIGLNYRGHAAEAGLTVPSSPPTFTKFASCLVGPNAEVVLPSRNVDWEVELVVVIGRRAERVKEADAWSYVAGLTVGQDLSERVVQLAGPAPQFSLGKSFPGFGPTGPALVTLDEFDDPDDLELICSVNGEVLQKGRTSDLVFSVPELIARLSAVCPLLPGDIIFTGTPAGVGFVRKPPRFLVPSDVMLSSISVIGELHTTFSAGVDYDDAAQN
jgi:2-keto-4-pentenoate hydratase/2-oxohepta-3-ene-1,7-dioic acid hydratase in catechol pathway